MLLKGRTQPQHATSSSAQYPVSNQKSPDRQRGGLSVPSWKRRYPSSLPVTIRLQLYIAWHMTGAQCADILIIMIYVGNYSSPQTCKILSGGFSSCQHIVQWKPSLVRTMLSQHSLSVFIFLKRNYEKFKNSNL